jgi:hypothetical protein
MCILTHSQLNVLQEVVETEAVLDARLHQLHKIVYPILTYN